MNEYEMLQAVYAVRAAGAADAGEFFTVLSVPILGSLALFHTDEHTIRIDIVGMRRGLDASGRPAEPCKLPQ